jgi:Ca2+-binding EF-hand superfamily protein
VTLFRDSALYDTTNGSFDDKFDNFGSSVVALFVLLTDDNYSMMYKALQESQGAALLFFVPYLVVGVFFVMTLLVAVIFEYYKYEHGMRVLEQKVYERKALLAAFRMADVDGSGSISRGELRRLMAKAVALEEGGIGLAIANQDEEDLLSGRRNGRRRGSKGGNLGCMERLRRRGWRWLFRHMSCRRRYFSGRSRAEWEMLFNLLDKDGDSSVGRAEFETICGLMMLRIREQTVHMGRKNRKASVGASATDAGGGDGGLLSPRSMLSPRGTDIPSPIARAYSGLLAATAQKRRSDLQRAAERIAGLPFFEGMIRYGIYLYILCIVLTYCNAIGESTFIAIDGGCLALLTVESFIKICANPHLSHSGFLAAVRGYWSADGGWNKFDAAAVLVSYIGIVLLALTTAYASDEVDQTSLSCPFNADLGTAASGTVLVSVWCIRRLRAYRMLRVIRAATIVTHVPSTRSMLRTFRSVVGMFTAIGLVTVAVTSFYATISTEMFAEKLTAYANHGGTSTNAKISRGGAGGSVGLGGAAVGDNGFVGGAAVGDDGLYGYYCGNWCPSYDTYGRSMLLHFQFLMLADWSDVMYKLMSETHYTACLVPISYVLLVSVILVNLLGALVLEIHQLQRAHERKLLTGDELEINARLFPNKALKWKEDFHRELRLQVVMTEGVTSAFENADVNKTGDVSVENLLPLVQTLQSQRKQHRRSRQKKRHRKKASTAQVMSKVPGLSKMPSIVMGSSPFFKGRKVVGAKVGGAKVTAPHQRGDRSSSDRSDGSGSSGDRIMTEVLFFTGESPDADGHKRKQKEEDGEKNESKPKGGPEKKEGSDEPQDSLDSALQEIETKQQLEDAMESSDLVTFRIRESQKGVKFVPLRDFVDWWQERELRRLYSYHDSNGDGSFDLEEFSALLDDIGIKCASSKSPASRKNYSAAGGHTLPFASASSALPPSTPVTSLGGSGGGASANSSDGADLSLRSYAKKYKPSSAMTASEMMAEIDNDGSGAIDYPEFLLWWKQYDLKRMFEMYDRDGSGEISFTELMQLTEHAGVKLNKDEIRVALTDLDRDSSGALSFDEFAPWWEQLLNERKVQAKLMISSRGLLGHDSSREEKLMNVERQDNFSRWEDDIFLDNMMKEKQDHEQHQYPFRYELLHKHSSDPDLSEACYTLDPLTGQLQLAEPVGSSAHRVNGRLGGSPTHALSPSPLTTARMAMAAPTDTLAAGVAGPPLKLPKESLQNGRALNTPAPSDGSAGVPPALRVQVNAEGAAKHRHGHSESGGHGGVNEEQLYAEPGVLKLVVKITLDHQFKEKHRQHLEKHVSCLGANTDRLAQQAGAMIGKQGANLRHMTSHAGSVRMPSGGGTSSVDRRSWSTPWRRRSIHGQEADGSK